MSFLQKLLFCARIACMPILELKEFRKALYSIIDIIFKRFIAYVLLIVSANEFSKICKFILLLLIDFFLKL